MTFFKYYVFRNIVVKSTGYKPLRVGRLSRNRPPMPYFFAKRPVPVSHSKHRGAQIKSLFTFPRKNCFMAELFRIRIKHGPFPIQLAVILHLKRITTDQNLGRTDKTIQCLLISIHQMRIHTLRSIAGHNQQYRHRMLITTGCIKIIGQILKNQPFIKSTKRGRHFRKIIRGPDDQSVRLPDCIQNRSQTIFAYAMAFILFPFTSETGYTTGVPFQPEQIESFNNRTGAFSPF